MLGEKSVFLKERDRIPPAADGSFWPCSRRKVWVMKRSSSLVEFLPFSVLRRARGWCWRESRPWIDLWIPTSRVWSPHFHRLRQKTTKSVENERDPGFAWDDCAPTQVWGSWDFRTYLPGLWWMLALEPHLDVTLLTSIFLCKIWTCAGDKKRERESREKIASAQRRKRRKWCQITSRDPINGSVGLLKVYSE